MQAPLRSLLLPALLLASVLLLCGCITPSQAGQCASFTNPSAHNSCLDNVAVLDQEPYLCYSINDLTLRTSCLEDANNPAAQQKLLSAQANSPAGTIPIPSATPSSNASGTGNGSALLPSPAPPVNALVAQCTASGASSDSCLRQVAVSTLNMSLCAQVSDGSLRASCISNVALSTKNQSLCGQLNRTADQQICTYYSSG